MVLFVLVNHRKSAREYPNPSKDEEQPRY